MLVVKSPGTGIYGKSTEPLSSIKAGEFLDYLRTRKFLKKDRILLS
jgi:hypothetical protein